MSLFCLSNAAIFDEMEKNNITPHRESLSEIMKNVNTIRSMKSLRCLHDLLLSLKTFPLPIFELAIDFIKDEVY